MGEFLRDLRYGVRILLKKPGFAAAAVLTLAAGIGANTAIFSVVDAVLLRALPYRDAGRLAIVWEDASSFGFPENTPAPGNFTDWKARNRVFEDMAAVEDASFNLSGEGQPERFLGSQVTANLFSVLGAEPALGRTFRPGEDQPGNERVAVLSYGLWLRRFGGDRTVIGKQIRIDGAERAIIGVMPRGFQFPNRDAEMWVPLAMTQEQWANHQSHFLQVVARLKPGVSLPQANADLGSIARALAEQYPDSNSKVGAFAVAMRDQFTRKLRLGLFVLLGASGFVLLIACANVANLLLARATGRRREMAVRMALGAGRARIVRQLLTETLLLAVLAGSLGLLASRWASSFLWQLIPDEIVRPEGAGLDWKVLGFTLLIALGTGALFGSAPAWRLSKLSLNDNLKAGGRGSLGRASGRLREFLVGSEVALAMVLLMGAGLFLQSFANLRRIDLGYRPENVLTLETPLPRPKYKEFAKRTAFYDAVLGRVSHLPGVVAAGYTTWVPLTNYGGASGITIEGQPAPERGKRPVPNVRVISPDYLRAMGVTFREGRFFDERDGAQTAPVAIVNRTMANRWWPGEEVVGRRLRFGSSEDKSPWITIIGIVADSRQAGIDVPARAEMYLPYQQQDFFAPSYLAVRATGDPSKIAEIVRQQIWEVDSEQPVAHIALMSALVDEALSPRMIQTSLLGGFAVLALLLASFGIYALLSFSVAQRTQEIGLRMALGAQRRDVFGLVLAYGLRPTLVGIGVGVAGAFALQKVIAHLLYEVSPTDPRMFAGVAVLLAGVAVAACYFPARRATRVDPMVALRYE